MLSAGPISLHYGKHLALDGVAIDVGSTTFKMAVVDPTALLAMAATT